MSNLCLRTLTTHTQREREELTMNGGDSSVSLTTTQQRMEVLLRLARKLEEAQCRTGIGPSTPAQ
ncbi:hypothetical protein SESBI_06337 [Sesbania bispinosa]|nr:hypothetical protein SESBI_06337 [Sesbania bispinosa]